MPFFVVHLSVLSRSRELCFTSIIVKPEGGEGREKEGHVSVHLTLKNFCQNPHHRAIACCLAGICLLPERHNFLLLLDGKYQNLKHETTH